MRQFLATALTLSFLACSTTETADTRQEKVEGLGLAEIDVGIGGAGGSCAERVRQLVAGGVCDKKRSLEYVGPIDSTFETTIERLDLRSRTRDSISGVEIDFRTSDEVLEFMRENGGRVGELREPRLPPKKGCSGGRVSLERAAVEPTPDEPNNAAAVPSWMSGLLLRLQRFGSRPACSPSGGLVACDLEVIIAELGAGDRFETRFLWHENHVVQPTVVAVLKKEPQSKTRVLLGAHLDSKETPGVDDNLSGVLLLLTIMKLIDERDLTFDRDLSFAFYSNEEVSKTGSQALVDEFISEGRLDEVAGVFNFDMVGRGGDDNHFYLSAPGAEDTWRGVDLTASSERHFVSKESLAQFDVVEGYEAKSDNTTWQDACVPTVHFRRTSPNASLDWYHNEKDNQVSLETIYRLAEAMILVLRETA